MPKYVEMSSDARENSMILPIYDIGDILQEEIAQGVKGMVITLEIIEMSHEEYAQLEEADWE